MATLVDYATTTGATATSSEPFLPKTNFIMQAIGAIDSGVTFTIEQAPEQESTATPASWTTAEGQNPTMNNTRNVSAINYAAGFKYRISKSANAQSAAVKFYWGHTTVLQSAYR